MKRKETNDFDEKRDQKKGKEESNSLSEFSAEEGRLRTELAAAYRLSAQFGWDDLIYNHISVRLPGPNHEFLINPYGLSYDEITASSLVKIDTEGNVLHPGSSNGRVNKAGFVIHSAIHLNRPDAICVLHNHNNEVIAVASSKHGLLPLSQTSLYLEEVTYHDYEGVVTFDSEKVTLCRDLGAKSQVILLRNHGAITLGRSVAEAFTNMCFLTKACRIQVQTLSCVQSMADVHLPSKEVQELTLQQMANFNEEGKGQLEFAALMRKLDRTDPSYRD